VFSHRVWSSSGEIRSANGGKKITCLIQGDSGEKVNIMGGDSIGHCGEKKFKEQQVSNCDWTARYSLVCGAGWRAKCIKRQAVTPDELLASIVDTAACMTKRKDQLRRTTRDLRTRVAECAKFDCKIAEHSLWTVTDPSLLSN